MLPTLVRRVIGQYPSNGPLPALRTSAIRQPSNDVVARVLLNRMASPPVAPSFERPVGVEGAAVVFHPSSDMLAGIASHARIWR
eukprot:2007318-Pyramimonas_sp.AAC.1